MLVKTKHPTIYVDYDETKNPFFEKIVSEALDAIAKHPVGKQLLKEISLVKPPGAEAYNVAVYSATGAGGLGRADMNDARFDKMGQLKPGCAADKWMGLTVGGGVGSVAGALNRPNAENKIGSRVRVRYNDKDLYLAKEGDKQILIPAFIPLAHELIHALHALNGNLIPRNQKTLVGKDQIVAEEARTTGLGNYAAEKITENAIRAEWKFPLRKTYP